MRLQVYKLVDGAVAAGCKRIRVHGLADGRDVQDGSSIKFFGELAAFLKKTAEKKGVDAAVASGGGRMHVTMDRYEVRRSRRALCALRRCRRWGPLVCRQHLWRVCVQSVSKAKPIAVQ
jgi:bisphosphoglycerate-independent phosphoglycerate mutase (AlkP superfamily)